MKLFILLSIAFIKLGRSNLIKAIDNNMKSFIASQTKSVLEKYEQDYTDVLNELKIKLNNPPVFYTVESSS